MNVYSGSRDSTSVYEYDGFVYHEDTRYRGRRFVCINKATNGDKRAEVSSAKSTAPRTADDRQPSFRAVSTTIMYYKQIFQGADVLIGPHAAYQHITKARAGLIPNVPNSLSNLPDVMSEFPNDLKSSYFGCFKTEENEVLGVVFSSPKLMEIIGHYETTELFIDGTFDARPKMPASAQLLVVQAKRLEKVT
ncbi:hypothetical protein PV326_010358 [Microctonus aethiopoides]|nr:hypothetical protein PV326_010358 [Microctonus aethiopoides]